MNARVWLVGAILLLPLAPVAAEAATSVDVTLWDKGAEAEMLTGDGYGPAKVNHKMMNMGIKLSRDRVPAGDVLFTVSNGSKDVVHELIVLPIAARDQPLPYVDKEFRVNEDAAGHLGEVSELDPAGKGSLTLNLKPGTYMVLCNVPMHYMGGMWQLLTVTR